VDLVGSYLDAASAAVTEMGGNVAKKLGDGLFWKILRPIAAHREAAVTPFGDSHGLVIWFYAGMVAPGASTAPIEIAMECRQCEDEAELFHKVVGPIDAQCTMLEMGDIKLGQRRPAFKGG
jgi:hypothetical protein